MCDMCARNSVKTVLPQELQQHLLNGVSVSYNGRTYLPPPEDTAIRMKKHLTLWNSANAEERRLLANGLMSYDELAQRRQERDYARMKALALLQQPYRPPRIAEPVGSYVYPHPQLPNDVAPPPASFGGHGQPTQKRVERMPEVFDEPVWWYCSDVHMTRHYVSTKEQFRQQADLCHAIRREQEQREYEKNNPKEPPPMFTCDMCKLLQEEDKTPKFLPDYPLVKLCDTCYTQMKPSPPVKQSPIDRFRWWHGIGLLSAGLAVNYGVDAWPLVDGISAVVAASGGVGLFMKWMDSAPDGDIP